MTDLNFITQNIYTNIRRGDGAFGAPYAALPLTFDLFAAVYANENSHIVVHDHAGAPQVILRPAGGAVLSACYCAPLDALVTLETAARNRFDSAKNDDYVIVIYGDFVYTVQKALSSPAPVLCTTASPRTLASTALLPPGVSVPTLSARTVGKVPVFSCTRIEFPSGQRPVCLAACPSTGALALATSDGAVSYILPSAAARRLALVTQFTVPVVSSAAQPPAPHTRTLAETCAGVPQPGTPAVAKIAVTGTTVALGGVQNGVIVLDIACCARPGRLGGACVRPVHSSFPALAPAPAPCRVLYPPSAPSPVQVAYLAADVLYDDSQLSALALSTISGSCQAPSDATHAQDTLPTAAPAAAAAAAAVGAVGDPLAAASLLSVLGNDAAPATVAHAVQRSCSAFTPGPPCLAVAVGGRIHFCTGLGTPMACHTAYELGGTITSLDLVGNVALTVRPTRTDVLFMPEAASMSSPLVLGTYAQPGVATAALWPRRIFACEGRPSAALPAPPAGHLPEMVVLAADVGASKAKGGAPFYRQTALRSVGDKNEQIQGCLVLASAPNSENALTRIAHERLAAARAQLVPGEVSEAASAAASTVFYLMQYLIAQEATTGVCALVDATGAPSGPPPTYAPAPPPAPPDPLSGHPVAIAADAARAALAGRGVALVYTPATGPLVAWAAADVVGALGTVARGTGRSALGHLAGGEGPWSAPARFALDGTVDETSRMRTVQMPLMCALATHVLTSALGLTNAQIRALGEPASRRIQPEFDLPATIVDAAGRYLATHHPRALEHLLTRALARDRLAERTRQVLLASPGTGGPSVAATLNALRVLSGLRPDELSADTLTAASTKTPQMTPVLATLAASTAHDATRLATIDPAQFAVTLAILPWGRATTTLRRAVVAAPALAATALAATGAGAGVPSQGVSAAVSSSQLFNVPSERDPPMAWARWAVAAAGLLGGLAADEMVRGAESAQAVAAAAAAAAAVRENAVDASLDEVIAYLSVHGVSGVDLLSLSCDDYHPCSDGLGLLQFNNTTINLSDLHPAVGRVLAAWARRATSDAAAHAPALAAHARALAEVAKVVIEVPETSSDPLPASLLARWASAARAVAEEDAAVTARQVAAGGEVGPMPVASAAAALLRAIGDCEMAGKIIREDYDVIKTLPTSAATTTAATWHREDSTVVAATSASAATATPATDVPARSYPLDSAAPKRERGDVWPGLRRVRAPEPAAAAVAASLAPGHDAFAALVGSRPLYLPARATPTLSAERVAQLNELVQAAANLATAASAVPAIQLPKELFSAQFTPTGRLTSLFTGPVAAAVTAAEALLAAPAAAAAAPAAATALARALARCGANTEHHVLCQILSQAVSSLCSDAPHPPLGMVDQILGLQADVGNVVAAALLLPHKDVWAEVEHRFGDRVQAVRVAGRLHTNGGVIGEIDAILG